MAEINYFKELQKVNVNDKVERKNGLSYLSWAFAWGELKLRFPDANYTVYESPQGWNYFTDGRTCWVKTGVTVNGIEHVEYLPVMNNRNQSIPLDSITSFDVNKAIQRSLTKAVARHGLGLYIYAGEDLPTEASADISVRDELRNYCKKEGIDQKVIIDACGLNAKSTDDDFRAALDFAKSFKGGK